LNCFRFEWFSVFWSVFDMVKFSYHVAVPVPGIFWPDFVMGRMSSKYSLLSMEMFRGLPALSKAIHSCEVVIHSLPYGYFSSNDTVNIFQWIHGSLTLTFSISMGRNPIWRNHITLYQVFGLVTFSSPLTPHTLVPLQLFLVTIILWSLLELRLVSKRFAMTKLRYCLRSKKGRLTN
jgi:hypothetical protein